MTSVQRKEVIKLHNEGYSYRQLAEKYCVNKNTIREIIKGYERRKCNVNSSGIQQRQIISYKR